MPCLKTSVWVSKMNYGWIDSHAHLMEDELYKDITGILNRALEAGVKRILVVCCTLEQAERAFALQEGYAFIDVGVGFHPEDANDIDEEDIIALEALLKRKKVSALGEIGLDYYWVKDNKEKQKKLFETQLKMAEQFQLPVLIHMRDASQDTYELLKQYPLTRGGIMHCYSGSSEMAKLFMDLGYYISFAGPVTFKNANNVKEVATGIPLERILIETDAPFLAPVPFRGKQNEPSYVIHTGKEICSLKGISEEKLQEEITKNYQRLFCGKEQS